MRQDLTACRAVNLIQRKPRPAQSAGAPLASGAGVDWVRSFASLSMHLNSPKTGASNPARPNKIVSAAEAVRLIHDGDTVATGGFVGIGFAEGIAVP